MIRRFGDHDHVDKAQHGEHDVFFGDAWIGDFRRKDNKAAGESKGSFRSDYGRLRKEDLCTRCTSSTKNW